MSSLPRKEIPATPLCNCPTCQAVRQGQKTLEAIRLDPNNTRGLRCGELRILFARLSAGLPPLHGALESLADLSQKAAA